MTTDEDRRRAALGAGLPPEAADRLRGVDAQTLAADAAKLARDLGVAGKPAAPTGNGFDHGVGTTPAVYLSPFELLREGYRIGGAS